MRSFLSEEDEDKEDSNFPRNNNNNNHHRRRMRSWLDWKEEGKRAYDERDFSRALDAYRKALQPEYECPTKADKAVLWSNVVACRLQLVQTEGNGDPQARAAVEDAKQCIQLNPNWAKGYIRLASAYIALGGHSNDACNALQSALRLDSGNPNAKQMLIRELRRDHSHASSAAASTSSSDNDNSNNNSQRNDHDTHHHRDPPNNPDYVPPPSFSNSFWSSGGQPTRTPPSAAPAGARDNSAVDDGLTWRERLAYHISRAKLWYQNLNGDAKTLIKIGLVLLTLYIAFGGRFGLGSTTTRTTSYSHTYPDSSAYNNRGNYGSDSAYEQYRRLKQEQRKHRTTTTNIRDTYYDPYDSYYAPPPPRRSASGYNFRAGDLFDGSLPSILILGAIAYLCHRNGINPFQALLVLNMMGGGGRRRMHYYGGGGGFGRRRGFRW